MKTICHFTLRIIIVLTILFGTVTSVAAQTPTVTVTSSSSPNPSVSGEPVTFTAIVTLPSGAPTGSVAFVELIADLNVWPPSFSQVVIGTASTFTHLEGTSYSFAFTTSDLALGVHAIVAGYMEDAVAVASSEPMYQGVVENRYPTVEIIQKPPNPSYSTRPTFAFTSDPPGGPFECGVSNNPGADLSTFTWSSCTSPYTLTDLEYYQSYAFVVKALSAPRDDTCRMYGWCAEHAWLVWTPTVIIDDGPPSTTEATEATIAFTIHPAYPQLDPPMDAELECHLAGGYALGGTSRTIHEWEACSSPVQFTGLSHGYGYEFRVRAGGSTHVVAEWRWIVSWLTVTSSPNPSEYGQDVTLAATVWAAPPDATVAFARLSYFMGVPFPEFLSDPLPPAECVGDHCIYTFTTASLAVGSHEIVALYTDGNGSVIGPARVHVVTEQATQAPVVTAHPSSQTTCANNPVSFVAAASGAPTPTVQWEVSANSGATWSPIAGATGTTYAFTAAAGDNGKRYRAVFTNSAGSATTNAAVLTVNTAPVVTTHPADRTATYGDPAVTFTAAASGTSPTVKWQRSTDGNTWQDISGATSATLTIAHPTVAMSGQRYRAVFHNGCGSATSSAATLTVHPKEATVTADNKARAYGEANPALTATVTGAVVGGDPIHYTLATTAQTLSDVGSYPIVVTLGTNPNYDVTAVNGTLTVNPKSATVTANNKAKVYGEVNPTLTATVVGAVAGGDTIHYMLSTTAQTLSNVGDYPIIVTLGTNPNYNVTKTDGTLTISPKNATVTVDSKFKTYGDANPELTATVTGAVEGGDTIHYTLSTTAQMLSNVGDYPIVVTLGTNPNYSVTKTDGTLTISARPVTVTADDRTKTYGDADPVLTYQVTGGSLVGGDAFTGALTRAGGESVGTYAIQQGTLALSSNYTLTFVGANLTINKRNASVTPGSFTRQYSDLNPSFTGTLSGFLESDGITAVYSTTAIPASLPGNYTITATLSPENRLGNYNITYHTGALTIVKEDAIVTFGSDNAVSVRVASPGGNSPQFSLTAYVREKTPDLPTLTGRAGDINHADVQIVLEPVGPGGTVTGVCATIAVMGTGYDAVKEVRCTFSNVPVNTYIATATVVGGVYTGEPAEDALVVYDPSLGFTTGGGWFYWPDTADEETGYRGDKTTFGYTMRYNKKATNIQGSLVLIRHLADGTIYRIKSNALYGLALGEDTRVPMGWASFAGKSTYLEPGWPQPVGNYEFMVYVEDRNEPGSGVDRLWIKVTDGLAMGGTASTGAVSLGGGNIVVPHATRQ
jgi:hypothetical protein